MYVYGELKKADLENLGSDLSPGCIGRIYWNTATLKAMVDDGTNIYAFLRNDANLVIGNNGTAASNVRLNRAAAAVLQFVTGDDATAEGSQSTSLAQISAKLENYTNAGLPAFGNPGRLAWLSDLGVVSVDTGAAWSNLSVPIVFDQPYELSDIGLSTSVATNALTIALKQKDGSTDPSTGSVSVKIGFRSATATSGAYNQRAVTGALSIVVPSGATLGQVSGMDQYVWVYAMDNAGTVELAVSGVKVFADKSIQSSTTIGAGSTSGTVLYSTTGRSNLPIRLIGRLLVNETVAGTWASAPSDVITAPTPVPNITELTSYTPIFTGIGTVANVNVTYTRNGPYLKVSGMLQTGTVAASNLTISLPGSLAVDSNFQSSFRNIVGQWIRDAGSAQFVNIPLIAVGGDTTIGAGGYLSGGSASSSSAILLQQGDALVNSGEYQTFSFEVPIQGWSAYGP